MIDTHCHLNFPELREQLDAVLTRAQEAGVDRYIVPGTELESSTSSLELSQKYTQIYAAVGVHPTDAHEYDAKKLQQLKELVVANKKLVSIGEVGLDYFHFEGCDESEIFKRKRAQAYVFREMITLAKDSNLPLIIHTRECFADAYATLSETAKNHPTVIHCFNGSLAQANLWLELGCQLSFTGMITYTKNEELRNIVRMVPLERMMLETDAPFLAPQGFRGQVCEPHFIHQIAKCVAEVKAISLEEVADVTTANAERFFKLDHV